METDPNPIVLIPTPETPLVFNVAKDNAEMNCPYKTPLIISGRMQGTSEVRYHPCNSTCAHFHLFASEILLTCGAGVKYTNVSRKQASALHKV